MIGIVVSNADPASERIGEALLNLREWRSAPHGQDEHLTYLSRPFELRQFEEIHLELANVASTFSDPTAIVFVSKHAGETGPLLTTHIPGNIGRAQYGGEPHQLPWAAPAFLRRAFHEMRENAPTGYDVGIECTHHGPSAVGAPTLFVEVGSGPEQWEDVSAAEAVARAVLALETVDPTGGQTIAGFGGGHYAPRFTRILRDTSWNVGHIASDWALDEIDDTDVLQDVVSKAIERSDADVAVIDGEHPELRGPIEATGIAIVSERWVRETDGVSFSMVDHIESLLGAIDDGTRIGTPARDTSPDAVKRVMLPEQIVRAVNGIEPEEAIQILAEATVAYETAEGGKRLGGSVLINQDTTRRETLESLRPVLESRFDAVEIHDDVIITRERSFDPAAAAELGVPEGPAFGQLANGESVTVDGTRVEPEAVFRFEEQTIPLRDT